MSESNIQYKGGSSNSLQSGLRFIYNSESGAIFTRTPSSWAKIGLFYLIYYACLTAFFAGLLSVFLYGFTDDVQPRLVGCHSVLPQNPGMGFRPQPDESRAIVKFDPADNETYAAHVADLDKFLKKPRKSSDCSYFEGQDEDHLRNCTNDSLEAKKSLSKPCRFDVHEMSDVMEKCVNQSYGYPSGQPCVVVKLNRVIEFVPQLVNESDAYLKIRCEGMYSADQDNIGDIEYLPKDGVDMWHFPYMGQKHYLSPLVFVKFLNPTPNVLVQVVCRPVNVKNIDSQKQTKGTGVVKFEILVGA